MCDSCSVHVDLLPEPGVFFSMPVGLAERCLLWTALPALILDLCKITLQNRKHTCEISHYSLYELSVNLTCVSALCCSTSARPACFYSLGIFTSVSHWVSVEISPTLSEKHLLILHLSHWPSHYMCVLCFSHLVPEHVSARWFKTGQSEFRVIRASGRAQPFRPNSHYNLLFQWGEWCVVTPCPTPDLMLCVFVASGLSPKISVMVNSCLQRGSCSP